MQRRLVSLALATAAIGLSIAPARATTRQIAELEPARLGFERSVFSQLTYGTYSDPYDELLSRPYNLLFANIGRHPNLSPWQGQEGLYTRYLNALIGNNGVANIDNDADAVQGALIRRESPAWAWGVSAAFALGSDGSDTESTARFVSDDELSGGELRVAVARKLSERRVLGGGVRLVSASSEVTDASFDPGSGGFFGVDAFEESSIAIDVGVRTFLNPRSSWEALIHVDSGSADRDESSDTVDGLGVVTDRFVATNYDIVESGFGAALAYNRLRRDRLGETQYRLDISRGSRELDNADLSYSETAATVTPNVTLLSQDAIEITDLALSARTVFGAGETEMFAGAELGFRMLDGATQIDSSGVIVTEMIDDSRTRAGLTLGVRQAIAGDRLRLIVSGRADLYDDEQATVFDSSATRDSSSLTTAQYAIGLEGVLSNLTLDVAWLTGDEAPVVPVTLGLPAGSRRSVEVDRLVFSAAASW